MRTAPVFSTPSVLSLVRQFDKIQTFAGIILVDIYKAIRDLQEEKKRVDGMIAALERTLKAGSRSRKTDRKAPGRRGRKSMSAEERQVVSERMKRYWAAQRAAAGESASGLSEQRSEEEPTS